jgi:hypothetical protein
MTNRRHISGTAQFNGRAWLQRRRDRRQLGHADRGVTALRWYVRPKLHAAPIAADAIIRKGTGAQGGNKVAAPHPNPAESASG